MQPADGKFANRLGMRLVFSVAVFLIYAAIPTRNHYWDGVAFALAIEDARAFGAGGIGTLLHPNHLFYNLIGFAVYRMLGASIRALYLLQFMNAAFAAITVYVLFGLMERATRSRRAALLLSAFFAFSGTWWRFSTDADAYILSVCLMAVCASLLVSGKKPWLVAAAHAAAMVTHQLAVFLAPAVIVFLWRRRRRWRDVVTYAAAAAALTLAAYAGAFRFTSAGGGLGLWAWLTSHSTDSDFTFNTAGNAFVTLRSWGQLFIAGRPSRVHYTEPFVVFLLAVLGVSAILFVVAVLRMRSVPSIRIHHPDLFIFSAIWIASYALFLFFWLPHNTFYKLFALPAVVLLVASLWPSGRNPGRPAVWFVCMVVLFNLSFAVIPYSRPDANAAIQFALDLRTQLGNGAHVHYASFSADDWFARYFNPQSTWQQTLEIQPIDEDLRAGRDVWLETTAIDRFTASNPEWIAERTRGAQWVELITGQQRIRFVRLRAPV